MPQIASNCMKLQNINYSKLLQIASNCLELDQISPNCSKLFGASVSRPPAQMCQDHCRQLSGPLPETVKLGKCVNTAQRMRQNHMPNVSRPFTKYVRPFAEYVKYQSVLRTLPTCIKQQTPKRKCDTELLGSDDLKLLQLDRTINDLLRECYDPSKHEFRGTGRAPIHDQMSIIFQFSLAFQFKMIQTRASTLNSLLI